MLHQVSGNLEHLSPCPQGLRANLFLRKNLINKSNKVLYETPEVSEGNNLTDKSDKRRAAEELRPLAWIHRECFRLQNVFAKSIRFLWKSKAV